MRAQVGVGVRERERVSVREREFVCAFGQLIDRSVRARIEG